MRWGGKRSTISPVGEKASPDVASRFLDDGDGGGRSDGDVGSGVMGKQTSQELSHMTIGYFRSKQAEQVSFGGGIPPGTSCCRRRGASGCSQAWAMGMVERSPRLQMPKAFYSGCADWEAYRPFLGTHESPASQGPPG